MPVPALADWWSPGRWTSARTPSQLYTIYQKVLLTFLKKMLASKQLIVQKKSMMLIKVLPRWCVAIAFILLGTGCFITHGEKLRFAGIAHNQPAKLCGAVAFIGYASSSDGSTAGSLQCVFATPSDAIHKTQWRIRRSGSPIWRPLRLVGGSPVQLSPGDYDLEFCPAGGINFEGNPVLVRVFNGNLATVSIYFKPCGS